MLLFMTERKTEKRIAVIMPAYNAEKYLEASVGSILAQTYPHFTLLIVNDGSTDSTGDVIRKLSEKDGRVTSLTVPNGGPAKARNTGLDAFLGEDSSADFIAFCDADDEYLPDAFERMIDAAAHGADVVFSGFTIVNPDGSRNDYFEPDAEYMPAEFGGIFPKLYKANLLNQVWGKLFRTELLKKNGFRFPDYRWGEDRLFIYDCLEASGRIAVLSHCGYLYKMYNSASLISGYYDRKPDVCKISDGRVRELCAKFGVQDDRDCRYMFLKSVFSCLTNLYSPSCRISRREKRAYAERILRDPYIRERIRNVGGGTAAKMLGMLLSTGSVTLNLAGAWLMSRLSSVVPRLFQKIKHKK